MTSMHLGSLIKIFGPIVDGTKQVSSLKSLMTSIVFNN